MASTWSSHQTHRWVPSMDLAHGKTMKQDKKVIGWREWVKLPDLAIKGIKAKIDTGARTSSLHAFDVETFRHRGVDYVKFKVHPKQRDSKSTVHSKARIHEYRHVKSSTGHLTKRPVIITEIEMLGEKWSIELTLANRDEMGFRMLLGREGFRKRMVVDAGRSFVGGKPKKSNVKKKS
jgi:hypothetical protein